MSGINWEKFGEEISKTVQDAVEHQDFEKLNQMITNTVIIPHLKPILRTRIKKKQTALPVCSTAM